MRVPPVDADGDHMIGNVCIILAKMCVLIILSMHLQRRIKDTSSITAELRVKDVAA